MDLVGVMRGGHGGRGWMVGGRDGDVCGWKLLLRREGEVKTRGGLDGWESRGFEVGKKVS